MRNLENI